MECGTHEQSNQRRDQFRHTYFFTASRTKHIVGLWAVALTFTPFPSLDHSLNLCRSENWKMLKVSVVKKVEKVCDSAAVSKRIKSSTEAEEVFMCSFLWTKASQTIPTVFNVVTASTSTGGTLGASDIFPHSCVKTGGGQLWNQHSSQIKIKNKLEYKTKWTKLEH